MPQPVRATAGGFGAFTNLHCRLDQAVNCNPLIERVLTIDFR